MSSHDTLGGSPLQHRQQPTPCIDYLDHPFQIQRESGLISQAVPGILLGKERIKEQEANGNGKVFERMIQVANTGIRSEDASEGVERMFY
jgi:hypothetical protein